MIMLLALFSLSCGKEPVKSKVAIVGRKIKVPSKSNTYSKSSKKDLKFEIYQQTAIVEGLKLLDEDMRDFFVEVDAEFSIDEIKSYEDIDAFFNFSEEEKRALSILFYYSQLQNTDEILIKHYKNYHTGAIGPAKKEAKIGEIEKLKTLVEDNIDLDESDKASFRENLHLITNIDMQYSKKPKALKYIKSIIDAKMDIREKLDLLGVFAFSVRNHKNSCADLMFSEIRSNFAAYASGSLLHDTLFRFRLDIFNTIWKACLSDLNVREDEINPHIKDDITFDIALEWGLTKVEKPEHYVENNAWFPQKIARYSDIKEKMKTFKLDRYNLRAFYDYAFNYFKTIKEWNTWALEALQDRSRLEFILQEKITGDLDIKCQSPEAMKKFKENMEKVLLFLLLEEELVNLPLNN